MQLVSRRQSAPSTGRHVSNKKKILLLQSTAAHKVCPRRCDDNLSTGRQRKRRPSQMSSKYDLIRFISASEESGQVEKLPENKLISGRR